MPITMEIDQDACRVQIAGDMTIYTALELKQEIVPCLDSAARLNLDLSQVNELDTAGLQLLILLKRESVKRGIRLAITGHGNATTDVIDTFNLAGYFGDPIVIQPKSGAKRQSRKRTAK